MQLSEKRILELAGSVAGSEPWSIGCVKFARLLEEEIARAQADARPVLWWNGIRKGGAGGFVGPSFSEKEGTNHDIPLVPAVNPCDYTHPEASAPGLSDDLQRVYDVFGIGEGARNIDVLLANIENVKRFAEYLNAVEQEFFMIPGEPDDDHPDEEAADECLVNRWGSTKEQYIVQFRAALERLTSASTATAQPEEGNRG